MAPSRRWLCIGGKNIESDGDDSSDEEDDDDGGYCRLNDVEQSPRPPSTCARLGEAYSGQTHSCEQKDSSKGLSYSNADKKARKLSRKLRRKEKETQLRHLLHVTWKWCRRGFLAAVPSMGAMFNFAPTPSPSAYKAAVYARKSTGSQPGVSIFVR